MCSWVYFHFLCVYIYDCNLSLNNSIKSGQMINSKELHAYYYQKLLYCVKIIKIYLFTKQIQVNILRYRDVGHSRQVLHTADGPNISLRDRISVLNTRSFHAKCFNIHWHCGILLYFSQTFVLNRDQTDEWRGWMQLMILIYHYTGASSQLAIYTHVRILVSAYLFLSGYGHFWYFFNKGDVSAHRLLTVRCFIIHLLLR